MQTDATTPNIVAPTMLGSAVHRGKDMHGLQRLMGCNERAWPNNVGRAVQTDPTLLHYASAITEQKKCWELLAEKFDRFQTLHTNTQQHATGRANGRNM